MHAWVVALQMLFIILYVYFTLIIRCNKVGTTSYTRPLVASMRNRSTSNKLIMKKVIIFFFFLISFSGYCQDKSIELINKNDVFNYIIDDCLGDKECNKSCHSRRKRKSSKGKFITPTILLNNFNHSQSDLYFNSIDNYNEYFVQLCDTDSADISPLITAIKTKKNLAVIDSVNIRNNRKDWILVYDKMDMKTVSFLCLSDMEFNKKTGVGVIYLVLDFGYLAAKGFIYIFRKENNNWNFISKRALWVS